jgi:hypothetical protein
MVTRLQRYLQKFRFKPDMEEHYLKLWQESQRDHTQTTLELAHTKNELRKAKEDLAMTEMFKDKPHLDRYGNIVQAVASKNNVMPDIPINLRKDCQITILGLPKDFHQGEAAYISSILMAYAQPIAQPLFESPETFADTIASDLNAEAKAKKNG